MGPILRFPGILPGDDWAEAVASSRQSRTAKFKITEPSIHSSGILYTKFYAISDRPDAGLPSLMLIHHPGGRRATIPEDVCHDHLDGKQKVCDCECERACPRDLSCRQWPLRLKLAVGRISHLVAVEILLFTLVHHPP